MKVKAPQGLQCPMEGKPREYITDKKAVVVPDTAYYRRMVDDGSLELADVDKKEKGA